MIEEYNLSVRLTPNQNILLCDIKPAWKQAIEAELTAAGIVPPSELDSLDRNAMACPALPLCGLAITEAERGLPDINRRVRALLDKVGLPGETIVMRMTGCPNGCAPSGDSSRMYACPRGIVPLQGCRGPGVCCAHTWTITLLVIAVACSSWTEHRHS